MEEGGGWKRREDGKGWIMEEEGGWKRREDGRGGRMEEEGEWKRMEDGRGGRMKRMEDERGGRMEEEGGWKRREEGLCKWMEDGLPCGSVWRRSPEARSHILTVQSYRMGQLAVSLIMSNLRTQTTNCFSSPLVRCKGKERS